MGVFAAAVLAGIPLLFLGYFYAYPVVRILAISLFEDGRFDGGAFTTVLTTPSLARTALFTVWQAGLSTGATLVLALPAAYVFARYRFRGRRLLRAAVTIPFVLPTVVVGSAFLALLGPGSPLGIDLSRTVWVILIAHVFYNYAVVVRVVGGLWEQLDPRLEEAALVLGAGRWQAFRQVTLPLLAPALAAAASIVFLFTFTSFGVVLILGGLEVRTLEVEIWRQATVFLNLGVAAALAIFQLVGVGLILTAYSRRQERLAREQPLVLGTHARKSPATAGERWFVALNMAVPTLLLGAPLALLAWRSFRQPDGLGLDYYRALAGEPTTALFVPASEAIANSLIFAVAASLIAITIGLMAAAVVAYRRGAVSRWFDLLLMLPLGTSAVTIGFGFLVALDAPVDLRASAWLIPVAHALVAIPLVVRSSVPVMRSIQTRLREAAAVLGASPARAWKEVDLPLVTRAAAVGLGFAFAISLGEFGATAFIVRPDRPTIPTAIVRLLSQPGALNFGQAMALSTLLMVLTVASISLIDRYRGFGEF